MSDFPARTRYPDRSHWEQKYREAADQIEQLLTASKAAFDALEDGDEAAAHLILQTLFRNRALEQKS